MLSRPRATGERRRDPASWAGVAAAVTFLGVITWALLGSWEGIIHSHPAYLILLAVGAAVALVTLVRTLRRRRRRGGLRFAGRLALVVAGIAGIAFVAWLRPYSAGDVAQDAMRTGPGVFVADSSGSIVFSPQDGGDGTGVFFQPGALVDPRAYAAVLRPVAEKGHTVVIAKQPLGIAFLATGAFDAAREAHPGVTEWIVGGHSLGGTVASMTADANEVTGLLLYASYPASDLSDLTAPVLSVSASEDELATTEKIDASRPDLPDDTTFVVIEGASHAQFGDYGPQSGDGVPTIGNVDARDRISSETVDFIDRVAR